MNQSTEGLFAGAARAKKTQDRDQYVCQLLAETGLVTPAQEAEAKSRRLCSETLVGTFIRTGVLTQRDVSCVLSAHAAMRKYYVEPAPEKSTEPWSAEQLRCRDLRQTVIMGWVKNTFGPVDPEAATPAGRRRRFLEEALELVQAMGGSMDEVETQANRVFARLPGASAEEIGGVGITLLALAASIGVSAEAMEIAEAHRVLNHPGGAAHFQPRHTAKPDVVTVEPPYTGTYKVVATDNFNTELFSDHIEKDGLTLEEANTLCSKLRAATHEQSRYWYVVRKSTEEDYKFEP